MYAYRHEAKGQRAPSPPADVYSTLLPLVTQRRYAFMDETRHIHKSEVTQLLMHTLIELFLTKRPTTWQKRRITRQ